MTFISIAHLTFNSVCLLTSGLVVSAANACIDLEIDELAIAFPYFPRADILHFIHVWYAVPLTPLKAAIARVPTAHLTLIGNNARYK